MYSIWGSLGTSACTQCCGKTPGWRHMQGTHLTTLINSYLTLSLFLVQIWSAGFDLHSSKRARTWIVEEYLLPYKSTQSGKTPPPFLKLPHTSWSKMGSYQRSAFYLWNVLLREVCLLSFFIFRYFLFCQTFNISYQYCFWNYFIQLQYTAFMVCLGFFLFDSIVYCTDSTILLYIAYRLCWIKWYRNL